MSDVTPATALRPPSGPMRIDLTSWDWNLRIAIDRGAVGRRVRYQGLNYGRDFTLNGRVRAPQEQRGRTIKITLSPFAPNVRFGRGGLEQVGRLAALPPASDFDFEAVLMLPEDAIATTATSLASTWRHLQINTFFDDPRRVAAYFFAAATGPRAEA